MIHNEAEFIEFLIKAKQNTYAGDGAQVDSSRPASHDLSYEEGSYRYYDTYLGGFNFIGEEAVWHAGQPVWGMNYFGWMLVDHIPDGFGEMLKAALRQVPAEAPFRGPATVRQGHFEYHCAWSGNLRSFVGQEEIRLKGKKIYALEFHGGEIREA